jgi:hypothetical protein
VAGVDGGRCIRGLTVSEFVRDRSSVARLIIDWLRPDHAIEHGKLRRAINNRSRADNIQSLTLSITTKILVPRCESREHALFCASTLGLRRPTQHSAFSRQQPASKAARGPSWEAEHTAFRNQKSRRQSCQRLGQRHLPTCIRTPTLRSGEFDAAGALVLAHCGELESSSV